MRLDNLEQLICRIVDPDQWMDISSAILQQTDLDFLKILCYTTRCKEKTAITMCKVSKLEKGSANGEYYAITYANTTSKN